MLSQWYQIARHIIIICSSEFLKISKNICRYREVQLRSSAELQNLFILGYMCVYIHMCICMHIYVFIYTHICMYVGFFTSLGY